MILRDLKTGDKFYPKSMAEKTTPIYEVVDTVTGISAKVKCKNLLTGVFLKKLAKLEVIKSK